MVRGCRAACAILALHVACGYDADIRFLRPSVSRIYPLGLAGRAGAGARADLLLGLCGQPYAGIGPQDRVLVDRSVVRVGELGSQAFSVSSLEVATSAGAQRVTPTVRGVVHLGRAAPRHLILVLDHSAAAARADVEDQRVRGARLVLGHALCPAGEVCAPDRPARAEVSLIVLRDGRAHTWLRRVTTTGDASAGLDSLERSAPTGAAPLWDGVLAGLALAAQTRGQGSAMVMVYWASGADAGSRASLALVQASLDGVTPLVVIDQGSMPQGSLGLVAESRGLVLETGGGQALYEAFRAAGLTGEGWWVLDLSLSPALPAGGSRVAGSLTLTLGQRSWTSSFKTPLLARP